MCSYLSKEEAKCSQAMKQAFKETLENGASYYEQMKTINYSCMFMKKGVLITRGSIPHARIMAEGSFSCCCQFF